MLVDYPENVLKLATFSLNPNLLLKDSSCLFFIVGAKIFDQLKMELVALMTSVYFMTL